MYRWDHNYVIYSDEPRSGLDENDFLWMPATKTFSGSVAETYSYDADGRLLKVEIAPEIGVVNAYETGIVGSGTFGASATRALYTYDSQGRLATQTDYEKNGSTVAFSRTGVTYNASGQIISETQSVKQGADTIVSYIVNTYGSSGTYALGAVVTVSADTWKNGSDSAIPDTLTTNTNNTYAWLGLAVHPSLPVSPAHAGVSVDMLYA